MAGVQAGRLSIEIVAEIARLQQDLDRAKRAVRDASKDIAKNTRAANDNVERGFRWFGFWRRGAEEAGRSAGLASHHMANLSFQLQDIVVGLQAGQRPMTVFLQQGGQIGQIMAQAGVGVGGLAKAVGSMALNFARAHPILTAIMVTVGVAAAGFKLFANEIDRSGEIKRFAQSLGLTKKEMEKLGPTTVTAGDAIRGLWRTIDEGLGLSGVFSSIADWSVQAFRTVLQWGQNAASGLYAAFVGTYNGVRAVWPMLPQVIGEAAVSAANAAIAAVEKLLNHSIAALNALILGVNSVLGTNLSALEPVTFDRIENRFAGAGRKAAGAFAEAYGEAFGEAQDAFGRFGQQLADNIVQSAKDRLSKQASEIIDDRSGTTKTDRRAESLARETRATEALIEGLYKVAEAYQRSSEEGLKAQIVAQATERGIRRQADLEAFVAQQVRKTAAERAAAAAQGLADLRAQSEMLQIYNGQVRDGLLTERDAQAAMKKEQELRPYTIALALAEGEEKEKLSRVVRALNDEIDRNNQLTREAEELSALSRLAEETKLIEGQRAALKELGAARLAALRGLSGARLEDELARINHEHQKTLTLQRALIEAERLRREGMHRLAEATLEAARAQSELADLEFEFAQGERSISRFNDQLADTIRLLEQIGGIGSALGSVLGLVSGNFANARGPLGLLLNSEVRRKDEKTGEIIASRLGDELRNIFGFDGAFGKALTAALANAGIGMAAGQMAGARGTAGQAGSAVGGILGGIAGEALKGALTKAATSALGKGLGSAIGSVVPVVGTILGGIAGGLLGGVLGGTKRGGATVGGSGGSLGVTGTWGNSSERVATASQLAGTAIETLQRIAEQLGATVGTFTGSVSMRKGSLRYDPTGRGISKTSKGAIDFGQDQAALVAAMIRDAINDGVFKGLAAGVERLLKRGGDLEEQLQKALSFQAVFDELERMKNPAEAALKVLEAEFKQLQAIFAEAGASAEEYAKLEELYALKRAELQRQDRTANAELSRQRELEIELMQLQGDWMGALALARQQELAELPDALHALQEQVWAAQLLNERRLLEIQIMEAQGDVAGALAAQREMELAATHESLRGLKQQLWALQDAQEAARAADQLRQAWAQVGDGIMDEVRRIRGLTGSEGGQSFAALMAQFNAVTTAARAGDIDAAKRLPALSQDLLRAAELAATSRQELDRVRAQAAASLEATHAAIGAITGHDAALLAAASAQEAQAAANDNLGAAVAESNRTLREEMTRMREELIAALAAVAGNTARVAKRLDDVTAASGGDAVSTVAA